MLKKLYFILFFTSLNFVFAQIQVQENYTLEQLVKNLEGPGVDISNITFDCESNGLQPFGKYIDSSMSSGLTEGLLLTSGAARYAIGPNNNAGQGQNNSFDQAFDPDIEKLIDSTQGLGTLYDLCKVEFDIAVQSDTLEFNYVFASEEYPEFVGEFHDLFGFFISGPGIVDTQNLALVPGTNLPISISTINQNFNSQFYVPNGGGLFPPYSNIMQYDGFTRVLTAQTSVEPCATYHIKLAIADEGDGVYDSGIFLESGSFTTGKERLTSFLEHEEYQNSIEECNKGYFTFHRTGGELNNFNQPVTIKFLIGGSAINGVDYSPIADSIIIPAFQDSINLEINAIADSIADEGETVKIFIISDCPAHPPITTAEITIDEYFIYNIPPTDVCIGEETRLNDPVFTQDFEVLWDSSEHLSCLDCISPISNTDSSQNFSYAVLNNETGCKGKGETFLNVLGLPNVFFTYSNNVNYTNLDVFFQNQSNANLFAWDFGDNSTSNEINPFHTYPVLTNGEEVSFTIVLNGEDSLTGCKNSHSEVITIANPFFLPNIITPNSDHQNDEFVISGIQPNIWSLRVFNRWGKQVFKTDQYNNRWTAEEVPDGVYYYKLENPTKDKFFKGWLQVLR